MKHKKKRFSHAQRRASAKRRKLGYFPLFDNPFPKGDVRSIDMHHVNSIVVIPLPHRTHKIMNGHDEHCKQWIEKLFLLDIDTLLNPDITTVHRRTSPEQDIDWDSIRDYETVSFG
jgi:hypothetical protein